MWKAGQDPALRMTVGIVLALDRAPSYDSLADRFSEVIKCSPRLQSRPGDPSFTHACPLWLEDDTLDVERHLRTAAVPRPGSLRQLLDLVSLLESVPFDPDHAPWDATLIEGLDGDRATLYLRAHHVVTDGLAGLRLAGRFLDGDEIDLREEQAPADGRRSGLATIDLTKALRPLQVAVEHDPRPGDGRCHRSRPAGGRRSRNFRFPAGGHHRGIVVAIAGRARHVDPLRGHLGSGRARRSTCPRRQQERLARCRAPRPGSVSITSASASRVTSCGSPPPPASVAATRWAATGLPPRASPCRPRPGPGSRTSRSSPTD